MRVLFAGAEGRTDQLQSVGVKNILTSYLAWQKRKFDPSVRNFEFVFIDSGAHSYFSFEGHGAAASIVRKTELPEPDDYMESYIKWLKENYEYFDYFAELDIGGLARFKGNGDYAEGLAWVEKWRQRMHNEGLGDKLVPVYHEEYVSMKKFEELCEDYSYIGLPQYHKLGQYQKLFDIGKKYNTRFHGFAMTKEEPMRKLPFFSVDSTSWLSGSRYGITYYFKGTKLTQTPDKQIRRTMKAKLEQAGISYEAVMADKADEVDRMNALAWREYGDWVDQHSKKYWEEADSDPENPQNGPSEATTEGEYIEDLELAIILDDEVEAVKAEKKEKEMNWRAKNLPAATRGKIMELRKDPDFEAKRKAKHAEALKMNTFNWKHGKFSKYHATPDYVHKYLSTIDNLDLSDPNEIEEVMLTLLRANLKRITLQQFFELADGGVQDKALTNLMKDTINELRSILERREEPKKPQGGTNNTQINFNSFGQLSDTERNNARDVLRAALEQSRKQNQD